MPKIKSGHVQIVDSPATPTGSYHSMIDLDLIDPVVSQGEKLNIILVSDCPNNCSDLSLIWLAAF